ncbi:MAG: hypothetical protein J4N95_00615 [Chloroflexi bacterium]|nr:hypothetical protein [Chloroflexota bacterium]MCI0889204.1 hypothetical protein [Chloroflexota bacterium]
MSEVMTQEEIDALVGSEPDPLTAAAAPEAAPAAAAPEPAPAAPAATPAPTLLVSADSSGMSAISQRLANLEAAVATLQQSTGGGQNDAVIQALSQQVQALNAQVSQLMPHLQNSLGYGLRGSFQCGSCGTQGAVGSRVSCMQCGTESWIGWPAQSA